MPGFFQILTHALHQAAQPEIGFAERWRWLVSPMLSQKLADSELGRTRDGMTGLLNKSALIDYGEKLPALAKDGKLGDGMLAIIMVDGDNFKEVNDTYGHDVGDEVIKHIANIMQQSLRPSDQIGRFGGEEFTAVICIDDIASLPMILSRLVNNANTHEVRGQAFKQTISVGAVAVPVADIQNGAVDYSKMVKAADDALYAAKAGGKNRAEWRQGLGVETQQTIEPGAKITLSPQPSPH
jgi:diguanylate cyclase (GGDEF)-like protein